MLPAAIRYGRHVLQNHRAHRRHDVGADAAELVYAGVAAEDGPVADRTWPASWALLAKVVRLPTWQSWAMWT